MTDDGPDAVFATEFAGDPVWAVRYRGKQMAMVLGLKAEACACLLTLQGHAVPEVTWLEIERDRSIRRNGKEPPKLDRGHMSPLVERMMPRRHDDNGRFLPSE